jgi:ribosomal protein L9
MDLYKEFKAALNALFQQKNITKYLNSKTQTATPMKNLKTLDKETIREMAMDLMAVFGSTTTLEIKNQLRAQGYMAFQAEISVMMDQIWVEEGWVYDCIGNHRIYRQPLVTELLAWGALMYLN